MHIKEHHRAFINLVVTTAGEPRTGLHAGDVVCQLLHAGSADWKQKELTPANWSERGNGVYALTLEPSDVGGPGKLIVLLTSSPKLKPAIDEKVETLEVLEDHHAADSGGLMETVLHGEVLTVDRKGKPKTPVIIKPVQPLIIGDAAVACDAVTYETDQDGRFEMKLLTGAVVQVHIQATNYQRQIVVPPPRPNGEPTNLFSI
jgi:hypothetical protein